MLEPCAADTLHLSLHVCIYSLIQIIKVEDEAGQTLVRLVSILSRRHSTTYSPYVYIFLDLGQGARARGGHGPARHPQGGENQDGGASQVKPFTVIYIIYTCVLYNMNITIKKGERS